MIEGRSRCSLFVPMLSSKMRVGTVKGRCRQFFLLLLWVLLSSSLKFAEIIFGLPRWLYRCNVISMSLMSQCLTLSSAEPTSDDDLVEQARK